MLQVVLAIVQNLEDLKFIVRLRQVPEHGEELLGQQVLLQEAAEDISRALHELDVRLLRVPDLAEDLVIEDPVDHFLSLLRVALYDRVIDNLV